ncbi:MAG TPA: DUF1348 family protein [Rubrobacteraceae bacterium]|nr:DUF1348 family protein [Rubrobacteraceae bacterium]
MTYHLRDWKEIRGCRRTNSGHLPPFDEASAREKVQKAEDAWNTRDPERVALAYTVDSKWRNRDEFFEGREAIKDFLRRKWARELDYQLKKELWCYQGNRISVRFEYESQDTEGQWWRSHLYDRIATPFSPPSAGGPGPRAVEAVTP